MRQVRIADIKSTTPGLVINRRGKIVEMDEKFHSDFYNKVANKGKIKKTTDDSIASLVIKLLDNGMISYIGNEENKDMGGMLFMRSLSQTPDKQLNSIVDLYTQIYYGFDLPIYEVENKKLKRLNIDDIYEECIVRKEKFSFIPTHVKRK